MFGKLFRPLDTNSASATHGSKSLRTPRPALLVAAAAAAVFLPQTAAAQVGAPPPNWGTTIPQVTTQPTNECVADDTVALNWLKTTHTKTSDYLDRTIDIYNNWNDIVGPKITVSGLSVSARGSFKEFRDNLFRLAKDVAIKTNPLCQDCVAVNRWSSLVPLAVNGVGARGAEVIPPGAPSPGVKLREATVVVNYGPPLSGTPREVDLTTLTDVQLNAAWSAVETFQAFANRFVLLQNPDTRDPKIAESICKTAYPRYLDSTPPATDYNACWVAEVTKCRDSTNATEVEANCEPIILKGVLPIKYNQIIDKLLSSASAGGSTAKALRTIDASKCKEGTVHNVLGPGAKYFDAITDWRHILR